MKQAIERDSLTCILFGVHRGGFRLGTCSKLTRLESAAGLLLPRPFLPLLTEQESNDRLTVPVYKRAVYAWLGMRYEDAVTLNRFTPVVSCIASSCLVMLKFRMIIPLPIILGPAFMREGSSSNKCFPNGHILTFFTFTTRRRKI